MSDPVTLEIFKHLFASVAEEMGVTLGRAAYSPNIKERLDYSCALFLGDGRMLAQAAHIPVHLGAMPASVQAALAHGAPFTDGDLVALNDPYLGGTHLPDITLVSPVFVGGAPDVPDFFVASRAHHADVGGISPGSMPLATELYQEGLIIPPIKLVAAGALNEAALALILRNSRTPEERRGDLAAQRAAHEVGARRLHELAGRYGLDEIILQAEGLIAYAERLTRSILARIPEGTYVFEDALDDDGITEEPVPIRVAVTVSDEKMVVDFTGTAPAVAGSVNAVRAIAESAVGYIIRCLAGAQLPLNHGAMIPIDVIIPPGSVLDPHPPHAVAGGNVETSMRIVDVLYGALAQALPESVPAASQGTMNNLTLGGVDPHTGKSFAYYETMGGGSGANASHAGASGVHCHMTNTLNTPIEALEMALPIRIRRYALREGSGGEGSHPGGDGLRRDVEFLTAARVTILSERRRLSPYGLAGGAPGAAGENWLLPGGCDKNETPLSGKVSFEAAPGDILSIRTPGGGGWGKHKRRK